MNAYIRKVQYHETDKMGIVHHSNYVKWMEEARIDYLEKAGYSFAQMEADGMISPLVSVECRYLRPTTFGDAVRIEVRMTEFTGVRLIISYRMFNTASGEEVCSGTTSHCFTDATGRPIILKRSLPKAAEFLASLVEKGKEE